MLVTTIEAAGSRLLLHYLPPTFLVLWGPTLAVCKEQLIHAMLSSAVPGQQQCQCTPALLAALHTGAGGSDPLLILIQGFGWESIWLCVPQKRDSEATI